MRKFLAARMKSGDVYITVENRFYYEDGRELLREYKDGLCYRARGSSRRHYRKKMLRELEPSTKIIYLNE